MFCRASKFRHCKNSKNNGRFVLRVHLRIDNVATILCVVASELHVILTLFLQCTYKSMTTSQFVNMILRPRTVVHKMSYVNILRQEAATRDDVGIANWFVSHSWKATFADTVNSILYFFQTQSPHDNDAVIWLDVFCDCQHRTGASTKEASWYMVRECACIRGCNNLNFFVQTTFRSAISKMGNLLLSIDDWRDTKPLERAW